MSLEPIRHEVIIAIAQTNEAIRDAQHALTWGSDREKVDAAGELDFLRRHKALMELRLREIEWRMGGNRSVLSTIRQAWFNFMIGFESWIAHG